MNPRDERGEAAAILREYLEMLRGQFYGDDEDRFFDNKDILRQAIAWPAFCLKKQGVWLPPKRIREILNLVVNDIKTKGNTDKIKNFSAYLLVCVQSHMKHHGDRYYDEGKTARALPVDKMPLGSILQGVKVAAGETAEQTIDILAAAAEIVSTRRKKHLPAHMRPAKKPAPAPANPQGELF